MFVSFVGLRTVVCFSICSHLCLVSALVCFPVYLGFGFLVFNFWFRFAFPQAFHEVFFFFNICAGCSFRFVVLFSVFRVVFNGVSFVLVRLGVYSVVVFVVLCRFSVLFLYSVLDACSLLLTKFPMVGYVVFRVVDFSNFLFTDFLLVFTKPRIC